MKRRMGPVVKANRRGLLPAVLLLSGAAGAQSSGGGGPSLFDNIFTGSLSQGNRGARRPTPAPPRRRNPRPAAAARRCPGAARTAPPAIR